MPRPPLDLDAWGKITRSTVNGQAQASAYYRSSTGRRSRMQRNGRTEPEAARILEKALKVKIAEQTGGDLLSPESTIEELAGKWLDELKIKNTVAGTLTTYRSSIRSKIIPGIGQLRLREATIPRLDRFLKGLMVTPTSARTARTVLLQMFALATRQGAVNRNPVKETMAISPKKREVKVIALADIHAMRSLFMAYDAAHTSELHEISMLLMATGCRQGEALAIRWEDVDVDTGVLRITGTLVVDDVTGKLQRQEHPKSEAGNRGLTLPATVLGMLTKRRIESVYPMVFPSSTGTYRWPNNSRRQWRQAIDATVYEGKTPRDFRKAVATHLDKQVGIEAAQAQLGHGSSDITVKYYVERQREVADFAGVIEGMFESSE